MAIGGQHVSLPALPQEQPAADLPGEDPGLPQLLGLAGGDQLRRRGRLELLQGARGAQAFDLVAVLEGEDLGAPFHVGHASPAELHVPGGIGVAGQTLGLDPRLHPHDRAVGRRVQSALGVAVTVHLLAQLLGDGLGGDDGARAQQRLLLPGLGVTAVVVGPRFEAAGQRAHLALGAQIGADPHVGAGGGCVEDALGLRGDGPGDLDARGASSPVEHHELHVRVGGVAHLARTEAAHRDDRHLDAQRARRIGALLAQAMRGVDVDLGDLVEGLRVLAHGLPLAGHDVHRDQHAGLEHGLGEVGERSGHLLRRGHPGQVGQAHAQQLAVAGAAQHVARLVGLVDPGDDGEELAAQHVPREGAQLLVASEPAHRLGDLLELLAHVAAGREHPGQALGGEAGVAQQTQVPVSGADGVGQPPEGQQAQVRVDPVGEPFEHRRQQLTLDLGAPRDALGQRCDVPEGPCGVAVADGGEPGGGVLLAQADLPVAELGGGQQQRAIEDLLVQPAHAAAGALVALVEVVGGEVQAAREAAQVRRRGGKHLGAAQAVQLQAVLDAAQEAVGLVHLRDVITGDVPALAEPGEGIEGGAALQHLVGPAVDHLQQLHGELHIPQPAGAELDVPLHLGTRDVGDHAAPHRPGVLDEAVAGGGLPHPGLDHLLEFPAQLPVPGRGARLQQRLELPGVRPFGVVAPVGGEGAHERTVLALRAEVRIDLPQGALAGALGAGAGQLAGERRTGGEHVLLGVLSPGGRDHVHDVDIGDVVELARSRLAERDHRPAHGLRALDGGPGDRGGRFERGIGEVADRGRDTGLQRDGVGRADVCGGDLGESAVVGDPQRVTHLPAVVGGDGHLGPRIRADGLEHHRAGVGGGHRELVIALPQQLEPFGMADEEVPERDRGAQQADQPPAAGPALIDLVEELIPERRGARLRGRLGQAQQCQHRLVAVGRPAQGLGCVLPEPRERRFGQEALDPVGAAEAEPRQGPGGGRGFGAHGRVLRRG